MVTATSRKQPSSKTKRNAKASSAGMPGAKTARRGKSTGARQSNETSGAAATMQTLLGRSKDALGNAYQWAGEKGHDIPGTARRVTTRSVEGARSMLEENPLVLAVIGLGLGLAVSTVMPKMALPRLPIRARAQSSKGRRRTGRGSAR